MSYAVSKMPSALRDYFVLLTKEIDWLQLKWQNYRELFVDDEQNIDLLNEVASDFFGISQRVLFNDILLSIARLFDRPKMGVKQTLSLPGLLELVDKVKEKNLYTKLNEHLRRTTEINTPFKNIRNQRIAHRDLATFRATGKPVPGFTSQMVEDALKEIRSIMSVLSLQLDNVEFLEFTGQIDAGGRRLIDELRMRRSS